jgi:translation initiation factor 6
LLRLIDFNGNPYIGVFCRSSERLTITPTQIEPKEEKAIQEALGTEIVKTTMGGTNIPGVFVAMNTHGIVVTNFAYEEEINGLESNVLRLKDRFNAVGNNILVNDHAALVNPDMDNKTVKALEDALGVEVSRGTIGRMKTVGSAAVVTNKGLICHPKISEGEMRHLKELFKIPVYIGTANYGVALLGACMIANSKGAVIGNKTTGIEMNRIEDALDLIE